MADAVQAARAPGSASQPSSIAIHRSGRPVALPPAKPAHAAGGLRPWVNDALNSRLATALPAGNWKLAWEAELNSAVRPVFVLARAAAVVVQGPAAWELFSAAGKSVAVGNSTDSDIVMDSKAPRFYTTAFTGDLLSLRTEDGKPAFTLGVMYGDDYERTYIARVGEHVIVASREMPRDPHEEVPVNQSLVELHILPEALELDETGYLKGKTRVFELDYETLNLHTALVGAHVITATPRQVQLAGLSTLRVYRTLRGDFEPRSMSLDETARIYLVAVPSGGKPSLWVLTPDGELLTQFELPAPLDQVSHPPIVGYDHRVYFVTPDQIAAIAPEGRLLWTRPARARFSGASVTADDKLLAVDGGEILAFGGEGERLAIFTVPDDQLQTAPILGDDGRLYVCGARKLYCLAPAK